MRTSYADSAQARESDYIMYDANGNRLSNGARDFHDYDVPVSNAEMQARRDAAEVERKKSAARIASAIGQMEQFFNCGAASGG